MILGYGIIAVPTGIVSAEYSRSMNEIRLVHTNTQSCPHCAETEHLDAAEYCHNCGNKF